MLTFPLPKLGKIYFKGHVYVDLRVIGLKISLNQSWRNLLQGTIMDLRKKYISLNQSWENSNFQGYLDVDPRLFLNISFKAKVGKV